MTKIWFDMDGTIADLYGVDGWLDKLHNSDATAYKQAKPIQRMCSLARQLNTLQRKGYFIGIISWLAKNSTESFDNEVINTKRAWLAKHLPSVEWDAIYIVPYGTPKYKVCENGILFDDESNNRDTWIHNAGMAFEPEHISEILAILNN